MGKNIHGTDEAQKLLVHLLSANLPFESQVKQMISAVSRAQKRVSRNALLYGICPTRFICSYTGVTTQDRELREQEIKKPKEKLLIKLPSTNLYDMSWLQPAQFNSISTNTEASGRNTSADVNMEEEIHQDEQAGNSVGGDSSYRDGGSEKMTLLPYADALSIFHDLIGYDPAQGTPPYPCMGRAGRIMRIYGGVLCSECVDAFQQKQIAS